MKLPTSVVKDFKGAQRNFDHMKRRVVGIRTSADINVSAFRSTAGTMLVGANVFALDLTGMTSVSGLIVIHVSPVSHWSFNWYPQAAGIIFNNSGAAQTVTVGYLVIGT